MVCIQRTLVHIRTLHQQTCHLHWSDETSVSATGTASQALRHQGPNAYFGTRNARRSKGSRTEMVETLPQKDSTQEPYDNCWRRVCVVTGNVTQITACYEAAVERHAISGKTKRSPSCCRSSTGISEAAQQNVEGDVAKPSLCSKDATIYRCRRQTTAQQEVPPVHERNAQSSRQAKVEQGWREARAGYAVPERPQEYTRRITQAVSSIAASLEEGSESQAIPNAHGVKPKSLAEAQQEQAMSDRPQYQQSTSRFAGTNEKAHRTCWIQSGPEKRSKLPQKSTCRSQSLLGINDPERSQCAHAETNGESCEEAA